MIIYLTSIKNNYNKELQRKERLTKESTYDIIILHPYIY